MPQLGRFDYTVQSTAGSSSVVSIVSGASVAVYREGATVNGNQSGTTPLAVTVRHAGKIATGDSVFINTTTGTTYTATRTSATVVTLSGFVGTLALSGGDRLTPSNSQPALYSDDQGGATTSNPLTSSSTGRANCWMEFGAYDVVVSGGGATTTAFTAQVVPTDAIYKVESMSAFATAGNGTSSSPWAGWEFAAVEGAPIHFSAGYYSTSNIAIAVTTTNAASLTRITGEGAGSTFITITSGTGQFRIYGSGGGTRVLQSVRVEGLNIIAGADNTSAGLVSIENFDANSYVGDIFIDTTASFKVTTAMQVLNSENCSFGQLYIRGQSASAGAAGNITTGLKITTNDGIQRGNMAFIQTHVVNCTTGLSMSSSGGSLDNVHFIIFKAVNSTLVDGTLAVSLATNVEQITFGDLHIELFNNGLSATGVENISVLNGLASNVHNVANTAGAAFTISGGDGGYIFCRLSSVYNGYVLSGTTSRYLIRQTAVGTVTGTHYTDSSSGKNLLFSTGTITGEIGFNSYVSAKLGFGFGSGESLPPLTVTANAVTATKSYHQIDNSGGAVTLKTINGMSDGDILFLRPNADAINVVFDETGNLKLIGTTWTMNSSRDTALFLKVGSAWLEITHSLNA